MILYDELLHYNALMICIMHVCQHFGLCISIKHYACKQPNRNMSCILNCLRCIVLPVGPPPAGRVMGVGCIANRAVGKGGVLGVRIPGIADWI